MRIMSTKNLKDGDILGKPVYSPNGTILLNSNVSLNKSLINALMEKSIPAVYIVDEISQDITMDNIVDETVKIKAVKNIQKVMESIKPDRYKRDNKTLIPEEAYGQIRNSITDIITNIKKNKNSLFNIIQVMSTDLYTFNHSVNVAILSILVAMEMEMSENQIKELALGAIMHDIGKAFVSPDILNKPSSLTQEEFEEIKLHTTKGYEMVKSDPTLSSYAKMIILMHHEKLDGSGYPLGVKEDKIHLMARIVGACDIFDALVSDKVYRDKIPVYRAIEILSSYVPHKIDSEVFNALKKKINPFPVGSGVLLNTGQKALVTNNNPHVCTRPNIRIVYNEDDTLYKGFKLVDLMQDLTLFIEDTCDIIM